MTISAEHSREIAKIYLDWDKFSYLNLAHWHDWLDQHEYKNSIKLNLPTLEILMPTNPFREGVVVYRWRLHPEIIDEYLDTDAARLAYTLFDSIGIKDEARLYLKMKWGFE